MLHADPAVDPNQTRASSLASGPQMQKTVTPLSAMDRHGIECDLPGDCQGIGRRQPPARDQAEGRS